MKTLSIVNVVATASVDQEIDFEKLSDFPQIFYDSDVYGGRVAYFKTKGMQGRVSIFLSGKMISVGTKKEAVAFHELTLAKDFLVDKGLIEETKLEPLIRNLVVKADVGKTIDIEKISLLKDYTSIYEPELFPGLILRISTLNKVNILLFTTGKLIITGLRDSNLIERTVIELENILKAIEN